MKIAIVKDTVPKPQWSEDWKKLCKEHSIKYREFDSQQPHFIDLLLEYNPDKTLWRSGNSPRDKTKDEAQREFLDKTGLRIVANWNTHYLYDHKIRQTYLFNYHDIPHPKTSIFRQYKHAMIFSDIAKYPFVVKTDGGAGSKSFRFIENRKQAEEVIYKAFYGGGLQTGHGHEKHVLYAQEYIKIDKVFRTIALKDKIAMGYVAHLKPGTLKASGQGYNTYEPAKKVLLNMAIKLNKILGFDWMAYDFIWSDEYKKYLVLECTDTMGCDGHGKRKYTYYKNGNTWTTKRENKLIQEYIFELFVLDEIQDTAEAPGC